MPTLSPIFTVLTFPSLSLNTLDGLKSNTQIGRHDKYETTERRSAFIKMILVLNYYNSYTVENYITTHAQLINFLHHVRKTFNGF